MENYHRAYTPKNIEWFYFRIAKHLIKIATSGGISMTKSLPSFAPFIVEPKVGEALLLSIELTTDPAPEVPGDTKLLSDTSIVWEERFRFEEAPECYVTTIEATAGDMPWKMVSSPDFTDSTIYALASELYSTSKLSWLTMVVFGQAALRHHTIIMHASVVEKDGLGYAFLGKSGTGKSTHSRLWLNNIYGTCLLNDDNPVIRVHSGGEVFIYGTPWSGKTPCYKQAEVGLGAIIRLEQAPFNQLKWKRGKEALIALLPSGSAIRWNPDLFSNMVETLDAVRNKVSVGVLKCLPNKEAACLCYREIANNEYRRS